VSKLGYRLLRPYAEYKI